MKARIVSSRMEDARALVRYARRRLPELIVFHGQALEAQAVGEDLRVSIKVMLDVLRSALDYCSKELFVRCVAAQDDRDTYFPIAKSGAKPADFRSLVNKLIPGLLGSRPDLIPVLASFQEFDSPDNVWLPRLSTLCNKGKHDRLTGERKVQERISVEYRFGSGPEEPLVGPQEGWLVDRRPAPEIEVPPLVALTSGGGKVTVNGVRVPSGQPIPCTRNVTLETWTSVIFYETGDPVMPFIETCIEGVSQIIEELDVKLSDPAPAAASGTP